LIYFYLRRADPVLPTEDVAATVAALIAKGKIRHFGVSETGVGTLRRANAVRRVVTV
jgi:aryl-alcohol dehydrogenase-like predicted oxidoreductase